MSPELTLSPSPADERIIAKSLMDRPMVTRSRLRISEV